MIVFPDTRGAWGPSMAGASASGRTAPTFEVSRPSRSRWASSASWERSDLNDEEDRPSVLRLDRGRFGDGDQRAASAYERGRAPEDVAADHVEHHIDLAGGLQRVGLQVQELVGANVERALSVGGSAGAIARAPT